MERGVNNVSGTLFCILVFTSSTCSPVTGTGDRNHKELMKQENYYEQTERVEKVYRQSITESD